MLNFLGGILFIIASIIYIFKGCPDNIYHHIQTVCLLWAYAFQGWANIFKSGLADKAVK